MLKNHLFSLAILIAITLTSTDSFAQSTLRLSVFDGESRTPIQNAFVTEIASGQTVSTDSEGECEFPSQFPAGTKAEIEVFAIGYPSQYREFRLSASSEPTTDYRPIYLYSSNQFLSPPIGPSGGQKSFSHGTGQMVTDLAGAPIGEYTQSIEATVPPGAIPFPVRIGFTPIKQTSWNVLYASRDLPQNWRVGAQCQISVFDLNGVEVGSPSVSQPIRLEVDPGLYFDYDNLAGWSAAAYHFDEVQLQWSSTGIAGSGIGLNGKLWVELDILENVTFMLIPPSAPSQGGEPGEITCWWEYKAPRDFNCSEGSPISSQPTDCPTGTQAPVDYEDDEAETDVIDTEWAASLGNALTELVGEVKGGSSSTATYTYKKNVKISLPAGSYSSWDGVIVVRETGRAFDRVRWCHDDISGTVEHQTETTYVVTGTQICKEGNPGDPDADGDGKPDGKPCAPAGG